MEAVEHLKFVCHLYRKQAEAGRWFLHEHPAQADSWGEQCVQDVLKIKDADIVVSDQCQYGQCDTQGRPIKKPTKWLSNSGCIRSKLEKRCAGKMGWCSRKDGSERHVLASGKIARDAAI